jgi:hypothetical protein
MIYTVFIPIALIFAPWLIVRFVFKTKQTQNLPYLKHAIYLWAASGAWILSQVLPNIPISVETDTFTMHSMGGVVAAILFLYVLKVYKITFELWWQQWLMLYFFVSGLGVLNELFEFFIDRAGIFKVIGGDEWWDLLANTVGAFVAFTIYKIVSQLKRT